MVTVVSYLRGIPASNNNPEKPKVLTDFITGVNNTGDSGILNDKTELIKADVAVIQGYVHEDGKNAPHLTLRQNILNFQKQNKNRTIIVDSNLFLYADNGNSKGYLRYSYDGIFPKTGEYCFDNPDPQRWEKIRKNLNIDLKPWRTNGNHILICLQRNGGWSMRGLDVIDFFYTTLKKIRKYTDRPIIVRMHPGDRKSIYYMNDIKGNNIFISQNKTLIEDLKNAWATIVYNSSPSVASIIEGVPAFLIDPEFSQAEEVANLDLKNLENPLMPDRLFWIQKISQCHWNSNEVISGEAWKHMKTYLRQ